MDEPELAGERLSMYGVPVTPFARSSSARDDAPDTDDSKASSTFFIGSLAMREQEGSKHSPGNDEEDFTMTPQSGPQQQSCSPSPTPQPLFLRIKQTQLPTIGDNQLPPPPPPPLEEQAKSRSSGVQVIRVVVPNFPGKSSSSSSQYFKEPLFYIPKVPELTKVPDPQPPKKAPLTGYDMRTLRKQVEFLQIEIQERLETQQLLYKQNEELWNYAQTLNQCNSSNVNIMRDQITRLHGELCVLHEERLVLADKLASVENSKAMLMQLQSDFLGVQGTINETERLSREAEEALLVAQREAEDLGGQLEGHTRHLQAATGQLDLLRAHRIETRANDRADAHWRSNPTTLRVAYHRFRTAVVRRLRCSRLRLLMIRVRRSVGLRMVMWLWAGFCHRRRVMVCNQGKRQLEMAILVLARWKLFTALEGMYVSTTRRRMLAKTFLLWAVSTRHALLDRREDRIVADFQATRIVRRHFRAWRGCTTFLEWHSADLTRLEQLADLSFLTKVLRRWSIAAQDQRAATAQRLRQHGLRLAQTGGLKPHFAAWVSVCKATWHRREAQKRRFFVHAAGLVAARATRRGIRGMWAYAEQLAWKLAKSRCVNTWYRWVQIRRAFCVSGKGTTSLRLHEHTYRAPCRRVLRALHMLSALQRRQRLCIASADRCLFVRTAGRALGHWRRVASRERIERAKRHAALLEKVFAAWSYFVPMQRRKRRLREAVEARFEAVRTAQQRKLVGLWRQMACTKRRLQKSLESVTHKTVLCVARRVLTCWRSRWLSVLFWREKEMRVEAARVAAVLALQEREREDLEREKERVLRESHETERLLLDLKNTLEEKEMELAELEHLAEARTQEKVEAQSLLALSRRELEDVREERERMKVVEGAIAEERDRTARVAQERREEAEATVRALEAETAVLREEVQRTRDQALLTEQQARDDVDHEREKLKQAQAAVLAAEAMVREREKELIELRSGDAEQQEQLKRLEDQLELVRREGARDVEVAERASRVSGSEARVTQSERGLARARVEQLRQLAEEHRELLRRLQLEDVALEEARERDELSHIQDKLMMRTTGATINNGKKTSSSSFSSSPSRAHRSSSKNRRPRGLDHSHTAMATTMMPSSMSFSHILPPRFSQSPHEQQHRTRARSDVSSHNPIHNHSRNQSHQPIHGADSNSDNDTAVAVADSDASASRSTGDPRPSDLLLDTGYPVVLDDFYSVDSPDLLGDRDREEAEVDGGVGGGAGNVSDSSLGLSIADDQHHPHSHPHSHSHPQESDSPDESMAASGSEPAAAGGAGGLEAPSAIIQRMKRRMMAFSLSPTTTPSTLPSPPTLPSSSMDKEIDGGDDGGGNFVDNDKAINATMLSSSSSSFQFTSPGKTDHEDEGVEDDEDYDEEEENRRYQVARSALRGIIQHTTTANNNNNNNIPVQNHLSYGSSS